MLTDCWHFCRERQEIYGVQQSVIWVVSNWNYVCVFIGTWVLKEDDWVSSSMKGGWTNVDSCDGSSGWLTSVHSLSWKIAPIIRKQVREERTFTPPTWQRLPLCGWKNTQTDQSCDRRSSAEGWACFRSLMMSWRYWCSQRWGHLTQSDLNINENKRTNEDSMVRSVESKNAVLK